MKATLEFDLDEGQDKTAHLRCVKAVNMAIALWDMDQYLRGLIKYGELDDAVQNVPGQGIFIDHGDKCLVDLEEVDIEGPQVAEA